MTTPPSSRQPAQGKICIRCGLDCSNRPRTKDLQGRYTCRDCYDAMQREPAIALPPASKKHAEHQAEPAAEADGGIYALLLEDAIRDQARVTTSPCPGCGHPLAADAAICTTCGYNPRTGQTVTTRKASASGPDIAVDDDPLVKARRHERRRQKTLATQMEYIKPLIAMAVGLGITCTLVFNRGGADSLAEYLLVYAIALPATVVGFLFCCWMWLGFDAPLPIVAVRLAAVNALVDILFVGIGFSGVRMSIFAFGGRIALPLLCYAALLMHYMELDFEDALMAGLLTGVVKVIGTIILIYWLANMGGG